MEYSKVRFFFAKLSFFQDNLISYINFKTSPGEVRARFFAFKKYFDRSKKIIVYNTNYAYILGIKPLCLTINKSACYESNCIEKVNGSK